MQPADELPEKIAYAMADKVEGPYPYKSILNEMAGNSKTDHLAIVESKGNRILFIKNGAIREAAIVIVGHFVLIVYITIKMGQ